MTPAPNRSDRGTPAERLTRALRGEKPAGLTCADVQMRLPQWVDAGLRGENIAQTDPAVAQHLLVCETCSALHALMLDAELAIAPAALPFPGVAAILGPSSTEEIQAWIMARTRELLTALKDLTDPAELERAVKTFFGLLRRLGGAVELQPAAAYAMGHGGELPPAARYLAAVYLATQWLAQDPVQNRGAPQRLPTEVASAARGFALRAAEDMGLPGPSAVQFANEFARLVTAPGVRLPVWPTKP